MCLVCVVRLYTISIKQSKEVTTKRHKNLCSSRVSIVNNIKNDSFDFFYSSQNGAEGAERQKQADAVSAAHL